MTNSFDRALDAYQSRQLADHQRQYDDDCAYQEAISDRVIERFETGVTAEELGSALDEMAQNEMAMNDLRAQIIFHGDKYARSVIGGRIMDYIDNYRTRIYEQEAADDIFEEAKARNEP